MALSISVYIATSLDGFIARLDGSLDWLPGADGTSAETTEDYGYQAFMDSVDALAMGRKTFDMVQSFGQWPYGDKPVFVLTNHPLTGKIPPKVETLAGEPAALVKIWEARGLAHLYLDGGLSIQSFLRAHLVDQLILTCIPILIGQGRPLFGPLEKDLPLKHLSTQSFPSGFVQSHYRRQ